MPEYISKNGKSPFEFDDFGGVRDYCLGSNNKFMALVIKFSTSYNLIIAQIIMEF